MPYFQNYKLYSSAGSGDVDGIRDALDNGAQIDSHGTVECWTALMCAARNGHINAVRYLIDRGANPNWHWLFIMGMMLLRQFLGGWAHQCRRILK